MKKLVVGSFAFVLTLMLCTSVFAQTYDITEYCGQNGIINRGDDPISGSGNVLNVKNDIVQDADFATAGPDENWVLGSMGWGTPQVGNTTINGNGHTFDGNGYGGFKMQAYISGEYNESTINNATLTNYDDGDGVIYVEYNDMASNKLNLNDVNIINNMGPAIVVASYSAEVDVVSKNKSVLISSNTGGIVNNGYLNFKGNNIHIKDTYISNDGYIFNSSNLTIDSFLSMNVNGQYPEFYNTKTVNFNGDIVGGGNIMNFGTMNIGGDASSFNGTLYVENGTVNLLEGATYFNSAVSDYNNGTLNLINNSIDEEVGLCELYIAGTMKLNIDVDLAEQAIDNVEFDYVEPYTPKREDDVLGRAIAINPTQQQEEPEAKISLNKINILSDATSKYTTYTFGEPAKEYIELASSQKNLLGTVFTYKVSYGEEEKGSSEEGGDEGGDDDMVTVSQDPTTGADAGSDEETKTALLQFERIGGGDGDISLDSGDKLEGPINPVFLQSKVAVAASSLSQEEVFDTVLNNAGNYTFFQKQGSNAGDVEDRAAPTMWIKAFGSQEDLDMEDYTKLKTTYYGAVVGLDWDRQYTDNFDATYGIFASYIGGEFKDEDWSDSEGDFKVKQNGGYVGLRGNWYLGKLFINGILDYGMIANTADNPYDSSDFNSSVIGLAARVGYNFEVARRRFTIQPSVGATGKYIITDDFETKIKDERKIKEEIDNITNITVEPGLKLALNLGKCWILSGEGKYVIENFSGDTKVKGEGLDFILPDTSYKNYTNVGLGIEKIWGYTVLHVKGNKTFGGRDGYIINAGIEFKF